MKHYLLLVGLVALAGCSSRIQPGGENLGSVTFKESPKTASTAEVITIDGERYDPVKDEAICNGALKAWRVAVGHAKPGSIPEDEWRKIRGADERESMRQLEALCADYPNSSYLVMMKGQVKQHFGRKEEAADFYEEAVAKNRHNPLLTFKLAETKWSGGKVKDAKKYYEEVIRIQPDFPDARVGLARCLLAEDKASAEARQILKEVLADSPGHKGALAVERSMK